MGGDSSLLPPFAPSQNAPALGTRPSGPTKEHSLGITRGGGGGGALSVSGVKF